MSRVAGCWVVAVGVLAVSGCGAYAGSSEATATRAGGADEAAGPGYAGGYAEGEAYDGDGMAEEMAAPSAQGASGGEGGAGAQPVSLRRLSTTPRFATVSLGGGETLELRRMRVSVKVEGLRARTVVDHVFYNPHARAVEGTFRYALPPEASVSSYAMFLGSGAAPADQALPFFGPADALRQMDPKSLAQVDVARITESADPALWGELRVGRVTRAVDARRTYEEVTRRRVDPALVEEVAPNTFEARVFPIQAHGFNRVLVAYEQTLPRVGDALEYAFPLAEGAIEDFELVVVGDKRHVASARYTGSVQGVEDQSDRQTLTYRVTRRGQSEGGDLSFALTPAPSTAAGPVEVLAGTNPALSQSHFLARVNADARFGGADAAYADQALFVVDTSLSEHPDRFGIDVALLRRILERSPQIRRFGVLTFDAGARWLEQSWLPNDDASRARVQRTLEGALLEGGTDFSAALDALRRPPMSLDARPTDVFVLTDGAVNWGQTDPQAMVARFREGSSAPLRFFAYRTGLGAENLALLAELTREGATFNCTTTTALETCATAHQRAGMRVTSVEVVPRGADGARATDLLVAGRQATLVPGAQLTLAGVLTQPGDATLRVRGTLGGQERTVELPVTFRPDGTLASRAWAEIAVAQLLSTGDESLEDYAVALSQHYLLANRAASFLVLETDAEYEQYDLSRARSAHDGAPVGALVEGSLRQLGGARTAYDRIARALRDTSSQNHLADLDDGAVLQRLSGFVGRGEGLLRREYHVPLVAQDAAPRRYRQAVSHTPDDYGVFRDEAARRHEGDDLGGAVRALSSIVENDPGSAESARAVAYRLQSWDARADAANLLLTVFEKRPYEPQSYRDLANALWMDRPAITAMLFEAAIAGEWHARFQRLDVVLREEYALFIRDHRRRFPQHPLAAYLREREQALGLELPSSALRVTMTWNTDNTDIDLWVTDPSGEKCYYGHREIASGGVLLDDITQGFGPERFHSVEHERGTYVVQAHYYGNNGNRLVAETHVTLTIAQYLNTPRETVRRYDVTLENPGDVATIARLRME